MSIRSTSMASMASGGAGATSQQTLAAASSGALIGSRDGIVGRYTDPVYTPAADGSVGLPHLPFDSIDMLEFWESGVRLSSIHLEILTELRFTSSGGDTLIISDRSGTAGEMPLLEIARPSMDDFFAQLPLVHAYSDLRVDRAQENLAQVGEIMSFIEQPISLHTQRHKNTIEFLFAAVGAVIEVQKRVKAASREVIVAAAFEGTRSPHRPAIYSGAGRSVSGAAQPTLSAVAGDSAARRNLLTAGTSSGVTRAIDGTSAAAALVKRAACAALLARPEAIGTPDAGGVMKGALLGATDPWSPGPFAPGSGLTDAPARIGAGVLSARFSKSPPRFEDSRRST